MFDRLTIQLKKINKQLYLIDFMIFQYLGLKINSNTGHINFG